MTEQQMRIRELRLVLRRMDDLMLEFFGEDLYGKQERRRFNERVQVVERLHEEAGLLIDSMRKA